ncbi:MAG: lipopolysaccharide heptosyltransferase II [Halanaerobiaceae bacterium]
MMVKKMNNFRLDESKEVKKILLVDLLYLGDLIFALPFIENLRENFPQAKIDMVVNADFRDILNTNSYIDNFYACDKSAGLLEGMRFARSLRKNGYDLGLNIHGNWRSVLLMYLVRPARIFGYAAEPGTGLLTDIVIEKQGGRHMVEEYLGFLEELELEVFAVNPPRLEPTPEAIADIKILLQEAGVGEGETLVGLNTGGSWESKRWPPEYFARLAEKLQGEYGVRVVFFGGSGDVERVDEIISQMEEGCREPVNTAGRTSLPELAALTGECDLVISGDSGPAHVAAAVGTPVVAIFGPSDDVKYRPYGSENVVIKSDIECRPCGEHSCPLGHHRCLRDITSERVLEEIEKNISVFF